MTVQSRSCFIIECNECKHPLMGSWSSYVAHFDSVADAESQAEDDDWAKLPDGRNVCDGCVDIMIQNEKIARNDKGDWVILP